MTETARWLRLGALAALLAWSAGCRASERVSSSQEDGSAAPVAVSVSVSAPVSATAELWLGGDVHLGELATDRLADIAPLLAGAAGIINLEGPVDSRGSRTHAPLLNRADGLAALAARGVRVAGLSNNHALDAGASGVAQTRAALRAAGIEPAGLVAGADGQDGAAREDGEDGLAVFQENGLRIAVFAHDLSDAHQRGELGDARAAELRGAIERARAAADVVVCTFHTAGPPSYLPTREARRAVEVALSAGADVIAVHGSHALAKVERRGRAVVAWGLGNLLFDCPCTSERDALIVRVRVSPSGVERAQVIPIDAGLGGANALPAHAAELTLELLAALGTGLAADGSVTVAVE